MNDSKVIFNFRVIIHTVQMRSDTLDYADRIKTINNKPYIIKPYAKLNKKGYLFPLNANKLYDEEIYTLTGFLNAIQQIQKDLDISEWVFDRVDFAFDTPLQYFDIFKYSLYIVCLLSESTGIKNAIDIQDVNTKMKRALTLKNSTFEFQIYNKALKSENKYPYSRFEFRFKNLRYTDIDSLIERLLYCIDCLTKSIKGVENQRINDLYELWLKDSKANCSNRVNNFSEFVRRYNNDIFTRPILKGLYEKICNGDFDNWLKKFRRKNQIIFITKSDIENIVKEMKIALTQYLK